MAASRRDKHEIARRRVTAREQRKASADRILWKVPPLGAFASYLGRRLPRVCGRKFVQGDAAGCVDVVRFNRKQIILLEVDEPLSKPRDILFVKIGFTTRIAPRLVLLCQRPCAVDLFFTKLRSSLDILTTK